MIFQTCTNLALYFIPRPFENSRSTSPAHNASHRDALWACRSAIFKPLVLLLLVLSVHFDADTFILLLKYILNLGLLLVIPRCSIVTFTQVKIVRTFSHHRLYKPNSHRRQLTVSNHFL